MGGPWGTSDLQASPRRQRPRAPCGAFRLARNLRGEPRPSTATDSAVSEAADPVLLGLKPAGRRPAAAFSWAVRQRPCNRGSRHDRAMATSPKDTRGHDARAESGLPRDRLVVVGNGMAPCASWSGSRRSHPAVTTSPASAPSRRSPTTGSCSPRCSAARSTRPPAPSAASTGTRITASA